jgi:peptidoglycan hydrolase-like protein with peptidoglycan-binding domain
MNLLLYKLAAALATLTLLVSGSLSSIPSTSQLAAVAPTSGLVGYWNFDEGSGTTASDASGNGNSGTINGAAWTTGKVGGALSFDGSSSVTIPNSSSINISGPFTFSVWINSRNSTDSQIFLGKNAYDKYVVINPNYGGYVTTLFGQQLDTTPGGVPLNTWTHLVFVGDTNSQKLYVNGVLASSDSSVGSSFSSSNSSLVLGRNVAGGYPFTGMLDELRIFNRALTSQEVANLYSDGAASVPPPAPAPTPAPTPDPVIVPVGGSYNFNNLPTNTWVNIGAVNTPSDWSGWTSWTYDPVGGKALAFGLNTERYQPAYTNDIWIYDINTNAWTKVRAGDYQNCSSTAIPGVGHPNNGISFDNLRRKFLITTLVNQCGWDSRTLSFDASSNTFSQLNNGSVVGKMGEQAVVYDEQNHVYVMFGGNLTGSSQNSTWTFDSSTNNWTQRNATDWTSADVNTKIPYARTNHVMVYDSLRKKTVMFGGAGFIYPSTFLNMSDVWTYDVPTNKWTKVSTTNNPPVRYYASFSYDSVNDVFLLVGGNTQLGSSRNETNVYDAWALDLKTNIWTQLPSLSLPLSARTPTTMDTLIYDPVRNVHLYWVSGSAPGVWAYRYSGTGIPYIPPVVPAPAPTPVISTSSKLPAGLGASTLKCIDYDGDSYGTGPGCTGRDADDKDSGVQTMTQAVAKKGSVQAVLAAKGYNPSRYWVVSTSGNDATCISHTWADANPTNVGACATWAKIQSLVRPGDAVFWRAGTYKEEINAVYAQSGTAAAPIIYMAYPGELAIIDSPEGATTCAAAYTPSTRNHLTFDGFKFAYSADTSGDRAINICLNDNLTIRNVEITRLGRGIYGGATLTNSLIENNVIYDQDLYGSRSHSIYLVSREVPNSNVTVRNNIMWNPGRTCIQHGGRITNFNIEGNVCYNIPYDSATGFALEQGVSNSFVRNNLVFNANVKPIGISTYDSNIEGNFAYDQTGNVIENNTFVVPLKNWKTGATASTMSNVTVAASASCNTIGVDLGKNTFRNNLLVNFSGGAPLSFYSYLQDYYSTYTGNGPDPRPWAQSTLWQNNDIFLSPNNTNVLSYRNTAAATGNPPCAIPTVVQGNYSWAQWTALNPSSSGNVSVDPLFAAYDHSWYATPENYNFTLQASSPVYGKGFSTDALEPVSPLPPAPTPVVVPALPTISNLLGSNTTQTSTVISWSTNTLTNAQLTYGTTLFYGSASPLVDSSPKTLSHVITLTNLTSNTLYHFKATSIDASGNSISSPDFTFTTLATPVIATSTNTNINTTTPTPETIVSPVVVYIPPVNADTQTTNTNTANTTTTLPPLTRDLSLYSKDPEVLTLQKILISLNLLSSDSVTGYFGPLTKAAVQSFQRKYSIIFFGTYYGYVGPATRNKLNSLINPSTGSTSSPQASSGSKIYLTQTLSIGKRGTEVATLQNFLIKLGYLSSDNNTGYYGNLTRAAVKQYQCKYMAICSGSEATTGWGMVGRLTRGKLGGN